MIIASGFDLIHEKRLSFEIDVPAEELWTLTKDSSYFYYCSNETIEGIEFDSIPSMVAKDVPIVCDMSSQLLTRNIDVSKVNRVGFHLYQCCVFVVQVCSDIC